MANYTLTHYFATGKTPEQPSRENFMAAADGLLPSKKATETKTASSTAIGKTPAQISRENFMAAADRLFPSKKAANTKTTSSAAKAVATKKTTTVDGPATTNKTRETDAGFDFVMVQDISGDDVDMVTYDGGWLFVDC
ncbi:hypothetical protein QBC34DRAFT_377063 [Podospora aff. communis PSN243]|uniref:Uncharacterized protein n=1 Tax=Podospora aff. communis PSN243 TaxID=3040156 RepID=A0AAV9GW87_9PEZI|nr:hypothetical protein QBC34DRAFT_377063 [Podospora aff. communis PSN243]